MLADYLPQPRRVGLASLDPVTRNADLLSWEIQYRAPGQYPNIAAIAHALPALDDPDNLTTAVDLMIEAIRGLAAAARDPNAPRAGPAQPQAPW